VLAATSANMDSPPHLFHMSSSTSLFKIIDVTRATSAMNGLFPAVSLSYPPIKFIDVGIAGYNNTTEVALSKAHNVWPDSATVVLSIGTDAQQIVDTTGSGHWRELADLSQRLTENCEAVHDHLLHGQNLLSYFHFNVDHDLGDVGVKEWKEAEDNGCLAGITSAYHRK
jgi:hypothetical protein